MPKTKFPKTQHPFNQNYMYIKHDNLVKDFSISSIQQSKKLPITNPRVKELVEANSLAALKERGLALIEEYNLIQSAIEEKSALETFNEKTRIYAERNAQIAAERAERVAKEQEKFARKEKTIANKQIASYSKEDKKLVKRFGITTSQRDASAAELFAKMGLPIKKA